MANNLEKLSLREIIKQIVLLEIHRHTRVERIAGETNPAYDRAEMLKINHLDCDNRLEPLYAELDRLEEVYTTVPQRKVYS